MTTADLIAAHSEKWQAATHSRFLDAIADGSLAESVFRTWLVQDHLYVSDLLSFQARLLSVAPRSGQAPLAAGLVALEAELGWFEDHAQGLNLPLDAPRHRVTADYAELLSRCLDDWAKGITALWTGERAYLDAWSRIGDAPPPYHDYVDHWTHPDFASYVNRLGQLVDQAGPHEASFTAVCELESRFWEMAWDSATT